MFLELIKLAVSPLPENLQRIKTLLGPRINDPKVYQAFRRIRKLFTAGDDVAKVIDRYDDQFIKTDLNLLEDVLRSRRGGHQYQLGNLLNYTIENAPAKNRMMINRALSGRANTYRDALRPVKGGISRRGYGWWKNGDKPSGPKIDDVMKDRFSRSTVFEEPGGPKDYGSYKPRNLNRSARQFYAIFGGALGLAGILHAMKLRRDAGMVDRNEAYGNV
jgi:hypothetical protein